MKTVLTAICNIFKAREITRETVRESIKQDAEREIAINWFYQAN